MKTRPLIVTFGELLLRLQPPHALRLEQAFPGPLTATFAGAETNVAVACARLGVQTRWVSALPTNPMTAAALRELEGLGVDLSSVVQTATGRMGAYYFEPGAGLRSAVVYYDRDGSVFANATPETYPWEQAFSGASLFFISGITPGVSENAATCARHAVEAARASGIPVAVDINFRDTLWRWSPGTPPAELATRELHAIAESADYLFAGANDLQRIGGDPENADALAQRYPRLKAVFSSRRALSANGTPTWGGTAWEVPSDTRIQSPSPASGRAPWDVGTCVDRLGIGDAFAGGTLAGIAEGKSIQDALDLGTACGAMKHSIAGDYLRCSRDEVDSLILEGPGNPQRVRR